MKTIYSKESIEENFETVQARALALGKYGEVRCAEIAVEETASRFGLEASEVRDVLEALQKEVA